MLPEKACGLILKHLKDIPAWPQLPKRSPLESMNLQYSRGFPGLEVSDSGLKVNSLAGYENALERLYEAYLADDYAQYGVSQEYAAGLHYFLNKKDLKPSSVKGQITGPISWCLAVSDSSGKSIIYDDVLSDAAARMLALSARWQETELNRINNNTLIFLDEPAMSGYGSVFLNLSREKIIELIKETLSKLQGLKGMHCCGNTDWSLVIQTGVDIISLDAYKYATAATIYSREMAEFVKNGGAVAWGIVPNNEEELISETTNSLKDRLEETMAPLSRSGAISFKDVLSGSLITPSCSLAGMSEDGAEQALVLLVELSEIMRKRHL